jgi:H/ACA ribonucleoprotein complex subunit 3
VTRSLILQCEKCSEYCLKETCPRCGGKAKNPLPPKYSPEDPYGEYRRRLKKLTRQEAAQKSMAAPSRRA